MADGTVLPIIVTIEGGDTTGALMNSKAFSKSVEAKILWIVHPETGRVLPWQGDPAYISLKEQNGCYYVQLPAGSSSIGYSLSNGEEDPERHDSTELNAERDRDSEILYKLANTIAQRKKDMPEGSYTTHLFQKGLEKIRKKVGEEAIELILAESKEDVVYESADLIYHLLVLLEAADVPFHDLMVELERRDS